MTEAHDLYVEPIPPIWTPPTSDQEKRQSFPAYYVASTAPNNVEDNPTKDKAVASGESAPPIDPIPHIKAIARFLRTQPDPQLLIVVHGYNTGMGDYGDRASTPPKAGSGIRGWYQDIRDHIVNTHITECDTCPRGLVLVGYRWPSEQIKGVPPDTLWNKIRYAQASLPIALKVILGLAISVLVGLSIISITTNLPGSVGFAVVGIGLLLLTTIILSIVLTLFILRIAGYLRDSYRATNFGVPDLVEFIRQLHQNIENVDAENSNSALLKPRIKLSFIGHSMGGFVVTNTIRILSDVFDKAAIGLGDGKSKIPSPQIGRFFTLERLVLVSPDIPSETIISGRANFLSSSLRRFREAYLFSNEGDMALRLASTAANYSSYPARTRDGGYRLGNVVVLPRQTDAEPKSPPEYQGIVNLSVSADKATCELLNTEPKGEEFQPVRFLVNTGEVQVEVSSFLQYLYIRNGMTMGKRQSRITVARSEQPIAELFTVFDCTGYYEIGRKGKKVGMLSRALPKPMLQFWDYVFLSFDYFRGKIDTHGGYFSNGDGPEPKFSKELIYGLACLGFKALALQDQSSVDGRKMALIRFSDDCKRHGIQVLLAPERYNRDVLGVPSKREGYV